ncbi:MAG: M20/M25/M40 family metallo-hydrolase [Syntrophales bacterium]|nr:M20/M25/M40 family metallo-hydrolase [Syntrophales bacterium]
MERFKNESSVYQRPVELLQRLIRFDTTNPPGAEAQCISFIKGVLDDAGVETAIFAHTPERPNLVARLHGQGSAPPLLLYGHVDVVTTENQKWQHPPFAGVIEDGFVWGRGTLDMKGGVVMMLVAFLRAKAERIALPGDIILTIVSDEELFGDFGARFLVENHADLFEGVRYAVGECGGFSFHVGNRRFYPIMVAEKQRCSVRATVRGQGGHGSMPVHGGAMARLSQVLRRLDRHRLPVHVTPTARVMIDTIARALGGMTGPILGYLKNPGLTDVILNLLGERGHIFDPMLHNTVSPTILHGSTSINVIPSEVSVDLDGRILPGFSPDDLIAELNKIVGSDVELEVIRHNPGPPEPDMGLFSTLSGVLREIDPEGVPVPFLLSASTDGHHFSRLGIQTYGFLPMQLPEDFSFIRTIHAADERVPVEALSFGTDAIYKLLQRFGG